MYQEKRPTCVTVIGWAWIIISGLMCFSSIMVLVMSFQITQVPSGDLNDIPTIFRYFPLLAILQICFSILGLISGINFLKLKLWARNILEVITWILLLFIIGFAGFIIYQWNSMSQPDTSFGLGVMEVFMMLMIISVYGVPLGIMLIYLRGTKVKNAIINTSEHAI